MVDVDGWLVGLVEKENKAKSRNINHNAKWNKAKQTKSNKFLNWVGASIL